MSQPLASLTPENEDGRGVVRRLHPLPPPSSSAPEPHGDGALDEVPDIDGPDADNVPPPPVDVPHEDEPAETHDETRAPSLTEDLKTRTLGLPARIKGLSRRNQILAGCAGVVLTLGIVSGLSHLTRSSAPVGNGQEVGYAESSSSAPPTSSGQKQAPPKVVASAEEHDASPAQPSSSSALTSAEPPAPPRPQSSIAQAPADDLGAMLAMKTPDPTPKPAPVTPTATTPPAQQAPLTAPGPVAAPLPDAIHVAATLQAAPMSDAQQTQVLGLVTEVAHLVEQQREELAQLRARLDVGEKATHETDHDLTRRVSLLEAGTAVRDARAPRNETGETRLADMDRARSAVTSARNDGNETQDAPREAPPLAPAHAKWTPHYRIVAASPQLVMLEDSAAPDGEVARVEAGPGTDLRGLGRILSISQKGTVWVIHTAHGDVY